MVGGLDELRQELMGRLLLVVAGVMVLSACSDRHSGDLSTRAGTVVDSILPPAEASARFVQGLPVVSSLDGGAATAEDLLVKLAEALSLGDTAAIDRLIVTRAEYGHLYYPSSVLTRKPYQLAPDVAWLLSSEANAKGRRRLLGRLGGQLIGLAGLICQDPTREGENTIRKECSVDLSVEEGPAARITLFNSVIERGGQAKILSLAGDY